LANLRPNRVNNVFYDAPVCQEVLAEAFARYVTHQFSDQLPLKK
jgi:hypothetical protein